MVIKNIEQVAHLLEPVPDKEFPIKASEIREILNLLDKTGGSVAYRAKIHLILADVVERTV